LGFPLSDEEMDYADDIMKEGIDIDDLDASTDDEDLLDDVEENSSPPATYIPRHNHPIAGNNNNWQLLCHDCIFSLKIRVLWNYEFRKFEYFVLECTGSW
jgi:hypothetical protein